jgi:cold shock CspA family protein
MRGEMLFFNDTKSFGFIRTEEGERLYVHRDGFLPGKPPEGRCAGKKVTFERQELEGELMFEEEPIEGEHSHQAVGVAMCDEAASGGRARLRRAGGVR